MDFGLWVTMSGTTWLNKSPNCNWLLSKKPGGKFLAKQPLDPVRHSLGILTTAGAWWVPSQPLLSFFPAVFASLGCGTLGATEVCRQVGVHLHRCHVLPVRDVSMHVGVRDVITLTYYVHASMTLWRELWPWANMVLKGARVTSGGKLRGGNWGLFSCSPSCFLALGVLVPFHHSRVRHGAAVGGVMFD